MSTRRPMAADVVGDFPTTGRMADQHDIAQVQRLDQRREIVGVGIHVVAIPGLIRAAVATTVVRDDAVVVLPKE